MIYESERIRAWLTELSIAQGIKSGFCWYLTDRWAGVEGPNCFTHISGTLVGTAEM